MASPIKRKQLKKQLVKKSKLVSKESLVILHEFELLHDDIIEASLKIRA